MKIFFFVFKKHKIIANPHQSYSYTEYLIDSIPKYVFVCIFQTL